MTYKELVDKLVDALKQSNDIAPMYRALMRHSAQSFLQPRLWQDAVRATYEAQQTVYNE